MARLQYSPPVPFWMPEQESTQWLRYPERVELTAFLEQHDWQVPPATFLAGAQSLVTRETIRMLLVTAYDLAQAASQTRGTVEMLSHIRGMLTAMIARADELDDWCRNQPGRKFYPAGTAPPYDPSTGTAYSMSADGGALCPAPKFSETKANALNESAQDCRKLGEYDKKVRKSRAAGIFRWAYIDALWSGTGGVGGGGGGGVGR